MSLFTWKYTELDDRQLGWTHWIYQWICIKLIGIYCYWKFRGHFTIKGRENRPKKFQSFIIACNHTSSLDPPLVSVAMDYHPISFMAKIELFDKPIMRYYQWLMSSFAVNRDKLEISTVKSALKVLKHGKWALGLFPEGTRQSGETLGEPKKGVAYFSKAAKAPVLPMAIVFDKPETGPKSLAIRIGQMIPPDPDMDAMTAKIYAAIGELLELARADIAEGLNR